MDPEDAGDFGTGAPRSEHRENLGFLVRHELGAPPALSALFTGYLQSGAGSLAHHGALEFGEVPGDHPDEVTRRLAPIGHKHINMRGILSFDLGCHRSSPLRQTPSATVERVPG